MPKPTKEQADALEALGLAGDQQDAFCGGEEVVFFFPTQKEPGIGVIQLAAERLRCGIVSVKDAGGGLMSLARFRANSFRVARAFQRKELELFGAAVVNPRFAELLQRQSFVGRIVACPDDLGGGEMEILAKTFEVPFDG